MTDYSKKIKKSLKKGDIDSGDVKKLEALTGLENSLKMKIAKETSERYKSLMDQTPEELDAELTMLKKNLNDLNNLGRC